MNDRARANAGFTLLELVCVMAIVALLSAIALPRLSPGTSRPRLEAYAVEIATILKHDRNAALRRGKPVTTLVDAPGRRIGSGAGDQFIRLPEDVLVETLLPQRCEGRPALSTISFFATGMSCGGTIRVSRLGGAFDIRVNWLTGGVDIVAQSL